MRSNLVVLVFYLSYFISSCDFWGVAPQPIPIQPAIPSRTPEVVTATLIISLPTINSTPTFIGLTNTQNPSYPLPETPLPSPTITLEQASQTFTPFSPTQSIEVEILGCNTSLDILNGMGEVTNAYVKVKNTGVVDISNTCAHLRAIDEGREHPDKKVCVSTLPIGHQLTYKLTVDSTYKKDTIIQVDVISNENVILRIDKQSCRDINLFGGIPSGIGTVEPIQ